MTHYFFDAGIFLSHPWASNTLSAGVPVPVPVVPVMSGGGSGGTWPAWRVKQKVDQACDDFVKEIARKFCPDPDEKKKPLNPYPSHLESLIKRDVKTKEFDDKRKIQGLQKRIQTLETRIRELKGKAQDKKRDSKYRLRAAARMERLGIRVRGLLFQLQTMFIKLEEKEAQLAQKEKMLQAKEQEIDQKVREVDQKLARLESLEPVAVDPEIQRLRLVLEERQRIIAGMKAAIPWAAGAVAVYLGTEHLVPQEKRVVRFLGYAASGALAVTALMKGSSVYLDRGGTAAEGG